MSMEGRRVPSVTFKTRVRDESIEGPNPFRWLDVTSDEIFAGQRVVVFSLPGAFTPTCTSKQCPAYDRLFGDMRSHGIDAVYCVSVNDAFVMYQWGQSLSLKNVKLIPDGSGHFTRAMDMLVDKDHLGFGHRSWRYSMIVNNGVIEKWFEEPGKNDVGSDNDPYLVTDPETMLEYLKATEEQSAAA